MELDFLSELLKQAIEIVKSTLDAIDASDVVAIIGAAAWIPTIVQIIYSVQEKKEIKNRTMSMQLIDTEVFNGVSIYECRKAINSSKSGSVVLLATNMFIPEKSFFVNSFSVKLKLCNIDEEINAKILGNVDLAKDEFKINSITIPNEYNFNLHREVICEKDNIRVFALFIENYKISSIRNIEEISFVLKGTDDTKTIIIDRFNKSTYKESSFLLDESCYRYIT